MGKIRAAAAHRLGAKVVGVYDIDAASARALSAGLPDCHVLADPAALFSIGADAAFVCAPPGLRTDLATGLVGRGIHTLIENTVGTSANAAPPLIEARERKSD